MDVEFSGSTLVATTDLDRPCRSFKNGKEGLHDEDIIEFGGVSLRAQFYLVELEFECATTVPEHQSRLGYGGYPRAYTVGSSLTVRCDCRRDLERTGKNDRLCFHYDFTVRFEDRHFRGYFQVLERSAPGGRPVAWEKGSGFASGGLPSLGKRH